MGDLLFFLYVYNGGQGMPTSICDDGNSLVCASGISFGDDDLRPVGGERFGDTPSYTTASSSHNCHFSREGNRSEI